MVDANRDRAARRADVERLETRRLLAAGFARFDYSGSTLRLVVTGTDGPDTITLGYNAAGDRYLATVNGVSEPFDPGQFGFEVRAGAGDDRVFVASRLGLAWRDPDVEDAFDEYPWERSAVIYGGSGNDTLTATKGRDSLYGEDGDDALHGGSQDDYLVGGAGADLLDGGSGHDTADYSDRRTGLVITVDGLANDGAVGEGDDVRCSRILGGSQSDHIVGDSRRNEIQGNGGADTLEGQGGNDRLVASPSGPSGTRVLRGGSGDDRLAGDAEPDDNPAVGHRMFGDGGDDTLYGHGGDDLLDGGSGNDFLTASAGNDTLFGRGGNDRLETGHRRGSLTPITPPRDTDHLDGGSGNDTLQFASRSGRVFGRGGDDTLIDRGSTFVPIGRALLLSGGHGNTTFEVNVASFTSAAEFPIRYTLDGINNDGRPGDAVNLLGNVVRVSLTASVGGVGVTGTAGTTIVDASTVATPVTLVGSPGRDRLIGGSGVDSLDGRDGSDTLIGNAGDDRFWAQDAVADTIDGGGGDDDVASTDAFDNAIGVERFV